MKSILYFIFALFISYLIAKFSMKKLRTKSEYRYIYKSDALWLWILAYMILIGLIVLVIKRPLALRKNIFLILIIGTIQEIIILLVAIYYTRSRAKVDENSIEIQRPFLNDIYIMHDNLVDISESYWNRAKRYIYTYVENGKKKSISVYAKTLNWQVFNEHHNFLLNKAPRIKRGLLFIENFDDIILEFRELNSIDQNLYIKSTFEEAINEGAKIGIYDANWSIGLSGLMAIPKNKKWANENLNNYIDNWEGRLKSLSKLIKEEQSPEIYELAYKTLNSIYYTNNEWMIKASSEEIDELVKLINVIEDIVNTNKSEFLI